ncbi:unnamed protein product [Closterium sp. Yama58-4]|nr:unnamed protein product [Closterium sp. Yama58-4]
MEARSNTHCRTVAERRALLRLQLLGNAPLKDTEEQYGNGPGVWEGESPGDYVAPIGNGTGSALGHAGHLDAETERGDWGFLDDGRDAEQGDASTDADETQDGAANGVTEDADVEDGGTLDTSEEEETEDGNLVAPPVVAETDHGKHTVASNMAERGQKVHGADAAEDAKTEAPQHVVSLTRARSAAGKKAEPTHDDVAAGVKASVAGMVEETRDGTAEERRGMAPINAEVVGEVAGAEGDSKTGSAPAAAGHAERVAAAPFAANAKPSCIVKAEELASPSTTVKLEGGLAAVDDAVKRTSETHASPSGAASNSRHVSSGPAPSISGSPANARGDAYSECSEERADVEEAQETDSASNAAGSDQSGESDLEVDICAQLAYIARKYNLPNKAITDIIQLFKARNWSPNDLDTWETHRDLEQWEDEVLEAHEHWEETEIVLDGDLGVLTLRHRPIVDVFLSLWERMSGVEGFATEWKEEKVDGVTVYRNASGCKWFKEATGAMDGQGIVACVILFSDVTHLSFNGRRTAHPLQFTLLNIPEALRWTLGATELIAIFPPMPAELSAEQKAEVMQAMLRQCLLRSGGLTVRNAEGVEMTVHPLLADYVCDHPESSTVTCTMAATALQPCSLCNVGWWDLRNVTETFPPRTVEGQRQVFELMQQSTPEEREIAKTAFSTHYVACALWDWAFLDTPWGNMYEAIGICILHVVDEGLWVHTMKCILGRLTPTLRAELLRCEGLVWPHADSPIFLSRRCRAVLVDTPASVLRAPDPSYYFRTVAQYAAWEHRAMMQIVPLIAHLPGYEDIGEATVMFNEWYKAYFCVEYHTEQSLADMVTMTARLIDKLVVVFPNQKSGFLIVKVHELSHLPAAILTRGMPIEYSTNMYEAKHKSSVKRHAKNTNWKDVSRDITVRHSREAAIRGLVRAEGGTRVYETAMRLAVEHNIRVLTKRSRRMEVNVEMDPVWSEYSEALGPEVMARAVAVMRAVGVVADTVQVHTALAIPPHDRMDRGDKGQIIKASPSEQKFSHVQIEGEGDQVWYGRCLMLFHFTDATQQVVRRALVKYYTELESVCPVTGCRRLQLTTGRDDYAVLEVDSILGLAHIVPSFTQPEIYLVNRFLF